MVVVAATARTRGMGDEERAIYDQMLGEEP
jgi:hypothetical protein